MQTPSRTYMCLEPLLEMPLLLWLVPLPQSHDRRLLTLMLSCAAWSRLWASMHSHSLTPSPAIPTDTCKHEHMGCLHNLPVVVCGALYSLSRAFATSSEGVLSRLRDAV